MPERIVIEPVTRIEGHAKITLVLGDDQRVSAARFHVTEFRGFEKICEGRPLHELSGLTARICGICPVSHLLASAKAGDAILAVGIPKPAEKLRRLMNLAQIIQSHALSFFHLSSPDLLLGFDSDPAQRNLFGLAQLDPSFARGGIRLRQFGQQIIERLGGKRIHPSWAVPGGVRAPLTEEGRDAISEGLPEAFATIESALGRWKGLLDRHHDEIEAFGAFPSLFLSLVAADGVWEHYDGVLRVVDASGTVLVDGVPGADYTSLIGEAIEPDSFIKSTYYKPLGYPEGMYRVGPLARLNVCDRMGTEKADYELGEYRSRFPRSASSSFLYHHARLIEILACLERIQRLLADADLLSHRVRAHADINQLEGVGVSEAPRGTLFHHYHVSEHGQVQHVNFLIATGQNNLAMNATVLQIAQRYVTGPSIPEGVLNRIEAGIRAFDPCLSCATHAFGAMPLDVTLLRADGSICDRRVRNSA